jgi:hypothetical protein
MPAAGVRAGRLQHFVGKSADLADKQGMKTSAVSYPQSLAVAVSEATRVSPRHGVTAYGLSLFLAAAALLTSVFFKEITHTYTQHFMGLPASVVWRGAFFTGALLWVISSVLAGACVPQKGLTRRFGVCSIGINLAAALLAACTLL